MGFKQALKNLSDTVTDKATGTTTRMECSGCDLTVRYRGSEPGAENDSRDLMNRHYDRQHGNS
jgi:hypothetical protein